MKRRPSLISYDKHHSHKRTTSDTHKHADADDERQDVFEAPVSHSSSASANNSNVITSTPLSQKRNSTTLLQPIGASRSPRNTRDEICHDLSSLNSTQTVASDEVENEDEESSDSEVDFGMKRRRPPAADTTRRVSRVGGAYQPKMQKRLAVECPRVDHLEAECVWNPRRVEPEKRQLELLRSKTRETTADCSFC